MRPSLLLTAVLAVLASPAASQNSLAHMRRVMVAIDLSKKAEVELDSSRLRTVTELRLRTAGLEVAPLAPSSILTTPVIDVRVTVVAMGNDSHPVGYAYSAHVELSRVGRAIGDTSVLGELRLWEAGSVHTTPTDLSGDVEKTIGELLDQFLNDWLAANPKR